MIQTEFAYRAKSIFEKNDNIVGLAVGGSWITNEIDEYSDLDLIVVTKTKITDDKNNMFEVAKRFDNFLSGFTGEHVGEPRLLICLYDNPLLHVDFKFVTIDEFAVRVETPAILLDKTGELQNAIDKTHAKFPYPDYQWIEDRFWIWIHYMLLKIGRGEFMETIESFSFLRMNVLGPLLHIKNGNLPRGVRNVETQLAHDDYFKLISIIPQNDKKSLLHTLHNTVGLYKELRDVLFNDSIIRQSATEARVMEYFNQIENNR